MKLDEFNSAKNILTDYLQEKKLRMIPKRFEILHHIYLYEGHFSIDSLYQKMKSDGCDISKATVYNSISLFLDAKLVIKHQFCDKLSLYEKSLNKKSHHHFICEKCGRIQEFHDEGIKTAVQTKRIAKFKQTSYSLCVYGICFSCLKNNKL